jgi:hypothetical protein
MRSFWKTAGEAIVCILVMSVCTTACAVTARSCVRDIGCKLDGGDVVAKSWSLVNGCLIDGKVK